MNEWTFNIWKDLLNVVGRRYNFKIQGKLYPHPSHFHPLKKKKKNNNSLVSGKLFDIIYNPQRPIRSFQHHSKCESLIEKYVGLVQGLGPPGRNAAASISFGGKENEFFTFLTYCSITEKPFWLFPQTLRNLIRPKH